MSDKADHPPVPEAFAALGVRNSILRGLADAGFVEPSAIQSLLIPRALAGVDILGQARTGTGKTAAFGIPVLQRAERGLTVQALIMVPTRELAVQVDDELKRLAKHTPIRSTTLVGGQKIRAQMKALDHNPEVCVGTPGRVIDLLDRRILSLDNVRFVVLDEVDRMLDIGFRDDIRNILSRLKSQGDHQTIFVSATISDEIERLARKYMREPVEKLIAPGADDKPTVEKIEQYHIVVNHHDRYRLLRRILDEENPDLVIVFTRTKHGAERLAEALRKDGLECREIHGNLNQNKRDRVMKGLRAHKFEVLVATDLASRGIDVAGISHIINYDIPDDPEVYIHRIGRTARMGAEGKAFTFVMPDQGDQLTKIETLINLEIQPRRYDGFEVRPITFAAPEPKPEAAPAPVDEGPPRPQSMTKFYRKRRR